MVGCWRAAASRYRLRCVRDSYFEVLRVLYFLLQIRLLLWSFLGYPQNLQYSSVPGVIVRRRFMFREKCSYPSESTCLVFKCVVASQTQLIWSQKPKYSQAITVTSEQFSTNLNVRLTWLKLQWLAFQFQWTFSQASPDLSLRQYQEHPICTRPTILRPATASNWKSSSVWHEPEPS